MESNSTLAARRIGFVDFPTDSGDGSLYWFMCPHQAPYGPRILKTDWMPLDNDFQANLIAVSLGLTVSYDCEALYVADKEGNTMWTARLQAHEALPALRESIVRLAAISYKKKQFRA